MKDSAPSPRRLQYLRDYRRRKRSIRLWQVCLLAGLFALWELTTRLGLSDGFLTSSPSRMAGTLQSLWHSGDLWRHIGTSCLETVVGFTAGTLLGTAIAVAMWWWEKLARVLDPYLVVLNALPKTALGPIFIVWMGAGMGAIIVMTLAISLIVTILTMYQGFMTTDPEKLRLMRSLGARRSQMLWLLVFPANCPTLFNTLKVNVGLSMNGEVVSGHNAETIAIAKNLIGMANNLNQLTKLSHQRGFHETHVYVVDLLRRLKAILCEYRQASQTLKSNIDRKEATI